MADVFLELKKLEEIQSRLKFCESVLNFKWSDA